MRKSDKQLLQEIKRLAKMLGRTPTSFDLRRRRDEYGDVSNYSTFIGRFGSWSNALERAGFVCDYREHRKSNEYLVEALRKLTKKLGHTPLRKEADLDPDMPCTQTYIVRFGSWKAALAAAGITEVYHYRRETTDGELLDLLRKIAVELGRTPTVRDLMKIKEAPAYATIARRFGSWLKALELAGLRNKPAEVVVSASERADRKREAALRRLCSYAEREGRLPSTEDLGKKTDTPCYRTCVTIFGSWEATLKAIKEQI